MISKSKKVVAKAKPAGKAAAKALAQAKAVPKKAGKGKVSVKPEGKKTVKSVTKSKPQSSAKATVAGKIVKKAEAKPVPKVKPASKAVKAPVKKSEKKPASKVSGKSATSVSPSAKKATTKPPIKTLTKAAAKTAKTQTPPKVKATAKALAKTPAAPAKPTVAATAAPAFLPAAPGVPARAGRPSSRLAQLTVPSMAQSVASTAAKASYSQIATAPQAVPLTPMAIKKDPKLANNWKTKAADQLTDAELLAMPDTEYMNEKQLAAFRGKLVTLKNDILSNAGETTEHLREDTVVVPDPADRATIEEEHALELRTRDRERKLLKKIEQSINRIDTGDYGYCDETGEPIGVGRLLARPTATLSLEAQQRRELKQKMFGD